MISLDEEATEDSQCRMCPTGTPQEDTTTVTMERDGATIVFKGVPADVCDTCGEAYLDEDVSARVCEKAEVEIEDGAQFNVPRYTAAAKAAA